MTETPIDPCVHCGHPRTGHGTRYAAIPGRHEWAGTTPPGPPADLRPDQTGPRASLADVLDPITAWLRRTLDPA
ncbi:hypothetical protein [Embleya sp. NPDC020630]|uniref:hypothetical protein n=1 Tax=Embleya sp. NPDC020630 TaxID=3363979 RepID=UPI00378F67C3